MARSRYRVTVTTGRWRTVDDSLLVASKESLHYRYRRERLVRAIGQVQRPKFSGLASGTLGGGFDTLVFDETA